MSHNYQKMLTLKEVQKLKQEESNNYATILACLDLQYQNYMNQLVIQRQTVMKTLRKSHEDRMMYLSLQAQKLQIMIEYSKLLPLQIKKEKQSSIETVQTVNTVSTSNSENAGNNKLVALNLGVVALQCDACGQLLENQLAASQHKCFRIQSADNIVSVQVPQNVASTQIQVDAGAHRCARNKPTPALAQPAVDSKPSHQNTKIVPVLIAKPQTLLNLPEGVPILRRITRTGNGPRGSLKVSALNLQLKKQVSSSLSRAQVQPTVKSNLPPQQSGNQAKVFRKKLFVCKVCGKDYASKDSLDSHMNVHLRRFKCTFCDKCLSSQSALTTHERTHTGEKPFHCPHCGFRCSVKCSLVTHIRKHTGEKPFQCAICGHRCRTKGNLDLHMAKHSTATPFECDKCGKRFKLKSYLQKHIKTHTGEKSYRCKICLQSFANWHGWKYHSQNVCPT